jgi:sodium-dependent dicarboxylate transporter 2/3/5
MPRYRLAGLIGGPLAALALLWNAPPGGLSSEAWCVAAVGLWMVLWWMTEAVPLAVADSSSPLRCNAGSSAGG